MKKNALKTFLILWSCNLTAFAANLSLESPAFKMNGLIPTEYTCDGADKSPPLTWSNAPAQTKSFALLVEDPDAPGGLWTHWVLFNIPADLSQLEAGTEIPSGAAAGKNNWGGVSYRGPCPPNGMHSYNFKLYALDKMLTEENGADSDKIRDAMTGHVIGSAEWTGVYQKQ